MRSPAPRTAGLVLAALQGASLVQPLFVVPLLVVGDKTGAIEVSEPMGAGDWVLAFATLAVLTCLGAVLLVAVWKVWRTASRGWLALSAGLLALQPLVWLYDARLSGTFPWVRGLLLPVLGVVLLLWPSSNADAATRVTAQPLRRR